MALRTLRIDNDEILKKTSRVVEKVDDRIRKLIGDMLDTMYENKGVGLAAPQIGVLKRVIVIDVGNGPVILINPVIFNTSGSRTETEGCLSVTKYVGKVERPTSLKVIGFDMDFNKVIHDAKDMFARALCHEIDHLDGVLITDRAIEIINKEDDKGDR